MSYPQSLASREVKDGQEFYRLTTMLQSGGDAYELDVSAKAFALGPLSDISRVRINYFDSSQASLVSSVVVGINTPFVGRTDAQASTRFPISNTPARLIVTSEDLWTNNWVPSLLAENLNYIKPKIDLLAYFDQPSSLAVQRTDFVERARLQIDAGNTSAAIVVPFFGRKYAEISVRNKDAAPIAADVSVIGVNFTTDGNSLNTNAVVFEDTIQTATAISAVASSVTNFRFRTVNVGMFDYMLFRIDAGAAVDGGVQDAVRYIIRTSDQLE